MKEKYGNKLNLEKEYLILSGFSIKIDIIIKKCGLIPRKGLSITFNLMKNLVLRIY
jgi:hypothetical protein